MQRNLQLPWQPTLAEAKSNPPDCFTSLYDFWNRACWCTMVSVFCHFLFSSWKRCIDSSDVCNIFLDMVQSMGGQNSIWELLKLHLGPWICFYTLYITNDILCACGIYCTSVCHKERVPHLWFFSFLLFLKWAKVFPDLVLGSKDSGCHNCAFCKAIQGKQILAFKHNKIKKTGVQFGDFQNSSSAFLHTF